MAGSKVAVVPSMLAGDVSGKRLTWAWLQLPGNPEIRKPEGLDDAELLRHPVSGAKIHVGHHSLGVGLAGHVEEPLVGTAQQAEKEFIVTVVRGLA